MRRRLLTLALSTLLCAAATAEAQVSFGIQAPGVSIGVNLPVYPTLVRVPNYPVYYDPQVNANYFFYDGLFWVYSGDTWYSSTWYDGPWQPVAPDYVPYFVLRIPVRYYREPPPYFHGWSSDAPPRWGEHWGHDWESHRAGWDQWNRNSVPAPAPLPVYQKQYSGDRYPHAQQQQQALRTQNYHYQPHEQVTRQAFQQQAKPAPSQAAAPARVTTPPATHPAPVTHTAQPRQRQPENTAATHVPSPTAEPARSAQAEHAQPQPHQQAAQQRPARAPQVAHQPEPAQSQMGRTAQANKAAEHAQQQHAQKAPPPEREAQVAHAPAGNPPNRAAPPAHPAQAQAKAAPKENHPAKDNGQARQEHEEKANPQQQGNADRKNEQHG